jgi:hypothetical protein
MGITASTKHISYVKEQKSLCHLLLCARLQIKCIIFRGEREREREREREKEREKERESIVHDGK